MLGGRGGRSCRKRLNRAGERVDPCGTPLCMCRVLDSLPSSFTWADQPEEICKPSFVIDLQWGV